MKYVIQITTVLDEILYYNDGYSYYVSDITEAKSYSFYNPLRFMFAFYLKAVDKKNIRKVEFKKVMPLKVNFKSQFN